MNSDRIKEIQESTAYPNSESVKQALLQVWNECEQDKVKPIERKVKNCIASINGALDGLQLDNTCDVVEKSFVIEQLNIQLTILNQ